MPGSMLILTWVGIIFVKIIHLAIARGKIITNIMPTHFKISIEPGFREIFLNQCLYEEFEDTKGVIRIRNSKKNVQHNGQKIKDKQRSTKHTHKTKDRVS